MLSVIEDEPGICLTRLQQRLTGLATADDLHILIATARVYVDLDAYALAEPEYVPVFRDAQMAAAHAILAVLPDQRSVGVPHLVEVDEGTPVYRDGRPWTIGALTDYGHEPLQHQDLPTQPRHGERPWELAHLDHTEVDLELLSARTGRPLGKAWVTLKTRPSAEPRYSSICERIFGTANTTFIHILLGNTQVMKSARQLTPAVDPKRHARWTFGDLYTWLCEWAYEVYETIDHPALGQSPRASYQQAEQWSGSRAHARIPYDRDFIIRTLPTTRKGTALVRPGQGVKINTILYWCSAFDDPEVERTAVAVRYDPFDIGIAYAFVRGQWIECRSAYYALQRPALDIAQGASDSCVDTPIDTGYSP